MLSSCNNLDKGTLGFDQKLILQYFLSIFSNAFDFPFTVTNTNGVSISSSSSEETRFCRLIKSTPEGLEHCQNTCRSAGREALKWNEPYIFTCHAGIIAWACPIIQKDYFLGNILSGQVLMKKPEKYSLQLIKNKCKALQLNEEEVVFSMKQLPVISASKIQSCADILYFSSMNFMNFFANFVNYRNELRSSGLGLWLRYNNKNYTVSKQNVSDLQNQIILKIKQAKTTEAKKLLNELVDHFFHQSEGQLEIIKGFTIEFISFLIRFATECGLSFSEIMTPQCLFQIKDLQEADTIDKIFLLFSKIGIYLIDLLSQNVELRPDTIVDHAIEYINANCCSSDLSLDEIANAVYISPTYLSRIFKRETGNNLTTFINKTRIEQSKIFLCHNNHSIEEIAEKVGYKNRIYYWKMFKRFVGISPSEYRKNSILP